MGNLIATAVNSPKDLDKVAPAPSAPKREIEVEPVEGDTETWWEADPDG